MCGADIKFPPEQEAHEDGLKDSRLRCDDRVSARMPKWDADGLSRQNFDEDETVEDLPVHGVVQPCPRSEGLAGGPVGPGREQRRRERKRRQESEEKRKN